METQVVKRAESGWPSLFDNNRWVQKYFKTPLDEYFNFSQVVNMPAVNVTETDDSYGLSIAAPGLDKKDIKIEVAEGMLTISAEKEKEEKSEKNSQFNRREYNYSSWSRSFTLPEDGKDSKIEAEYKNGELKIKIPRSETKKTKPAKSIEIN